MPVRALLFFWSADGYGVHMADPVNDWCEVTADSYSAFNGAIEKIIGIRPYPAGAPNGPVLGSRYVWRGQGCREWGLHSNLARKFRCLNGRHGSEDDLQTMEELIWQEALEWDLDWHPGGGRLSYLELLAKLQHHAAPTRLIDVTDSPHVALWFAVQSREHSAHDARVFAVDVSQCVPMPRRSVSKPDWPWSAGMTTLGAAPFTVWRPPPLDPRIDRQLGAFLVGPVPERDDEREHKSLSLTFADLDHVLSDRVRKGQPPAHVIIRIPHEAKAGIAKLLERLHGLSAARLFPDAAGFASFTEQAQRVNPWAGISSKITIHHRGGTADPNDREPIELLVARLATFAVPPGSIRLLWDKHYPIIEIDSRKIDISYGRVAEVCSGVPGVNPALSVRERTPADFSLQTDSYYS